jgi:probable non-F420 flavinoid oxidoreductase
VTVIGFHNSHEQVHPADLLTAVQHAEQVGFTAAMCSDHFAPWNHNQGHSGFAWSWLGAALASTGLPCGVVNAPGQRYHPAIIAQGAATLAAMFPGRFWMALGSGQVMNERITGTPWPPKRVRDARLRECVDVIRALLAGEEVTHRGLVDVERARIWSLPEQQPALIGPAVTVPTARRHADWADGMITINQPHEALRELVGAYRDAGGRGRLVLQVHLCWDPDLQRAKQIAYEQWYTNTFPPPLCWDLDGPEAFELASAYTPQEAVESGVLVSSDLGQHAAWLAEYVELGFDEIYLHHVGKEQEPFLDAFGERVLPQLGVTRPEPAVALDGPGGPRRPHQEPEPGPPSVLPEGRPTPP